MNVYFLFDSVLIQSSPSYGNTNGGIHATCGGTR